MNLCPYCKYPIVGAGKEKKVAEDAFEVIKVCSHCEAILRFEITTLKAPKANFKVNQVKSIKEQENAVNR